MVWGEKTATNSQDIFLKVELTLILHGFLNKRNNGDMSL